uniref:Uncharacterized protein n=1 Tax=Solanum tuberosum TaxID=4113 RepID=M1AUU0_SOLTU
MHHAWFVIKVAIVEEDALSVVRRQSRNSKRRDIKCAAPDSSQANHLSDDEDDNNSKAAAGETATTVRPSELRRNPKLGSVEDGSQQIRLGSELKFKNEKSLKAGYRIELISV